ncbi:MAG: hypothetical protein EZS28_024957, partial [Streblomastix strix]
MNVAQKAAGAQISDHSKGYDHTKKSIISSIAKVFPVNLLMIDPSIALELIQNPKSETKLNKVQQQLCAPIHQLVHPENDQYTNSNTNTNNPAKQNSIKPANSDSQSQSQNNDSQFAQSENNQTLIPHSVAPPRSASTFAIPIVQTPLPVYRDTSVVEAQKHLKS